MQDSSVSLDQVASSEHSKLSLRPTWDEYFMKMSQTISLRSPDAKRRVGCVVIDHDKRVVTTGYNGTPAGFNDNGFDWWDKEHKEKYVVHAEANALIYADGPRLRGGTLYCSYSPCLECAKLIAAAGIKRVVYLEVSDRNAISLLKVLNVSAEMLDTSMSFSNE